jgi:hypothetical protein
MKKDITAGEGWRGVPHAHFVAADAAFSRALPSRAARALPCGFWLPPQGRVPPKKLPRQLQHPYSARYPALAEGQGFISR